MSQSQNLPTLDLSDYFFVNSVVLCLCLCLAHPTSVDGFVGAINNHFVFDLAILKVCCFVRLLHFLAIVSEPTQQYAVDYFHQ